MIKKIINNPYVYLLLAGLLPALLMLGLIIKHAINVPVTDQYEFVPIFQNLDKGSVVFDNFWGQHNEHRVFFPNIILIVLARLTHWNILAEIYLSFTIACVTFVGFASLIKRHVTGVRIRIVTTFLGAAIFFSPVQWENWLWGWQLEWFLCVACIVWSVNLLDKLKPSDKVKSLIRPVILAVVATFSLGSGFLVWIIGAIILLVRRMKVAYITLWSGVAVVSLGAYYFNYRRPENGLSPTSFIHDIPRFVMYVFAYIGRPISDNPQISIFAGIYISLAYGGFYYMQFIRNV